MGGGGGGGGGVYDTATAAAAESIDYSLSYMLVCCSGGPMSSRAMALFYEKEQHCDGYPVCGNAIIAKVRPETQPNNAPKTHSTTRLYNN